MAELETFDAAVIGGGVSGLVAGAKLAAAGRAVFLVEQNDHPGGCCASFARDGFGFDTGTSSLSGLRAGGGLRMILEECGLRMEFHRPEIRETVITPGFTVGIPSDPERLEETLRRQFPREKDSLDRFFTFLETRPETDHPPPAGTFTDLLASCGFSTGLFFLLEAFLGNLGLPADRVDGATARALFREYLLDGGYYPVGGMSSFPESLMDLIRKRGGTVILGRRAETFTGAQGHVRSVRLEGGDVYRARTFIAATDARRALLDMVPPFPGREALAGRLASMIPSCSAFMVFLGLGLTLDAMTDHQGHLLFLPEGSMDPIYRSLVADDLLFSPAGYVYIIAPSRMERSLAPPGGEAVCLFIMAPYRTEKFWADNRERMTHTLIARAERVLPGLSGCIRQVSSATPLTIERYTGNCRGALYGWQAIPSQSGIRRLSPATPWKNLLLAGHWTRPGSGISAVAASGRLAARMVDRTLKEDHVSRH